MKKEENKKSNEETQPKYPVMRLSQDMHRAVRTKDAALIQQILDEIVTQLENPSLYSHFRHLLEASMEGGSGNLPVALDLSELEHKNEARLQELNEAVQAAKDTAGDTEVMDAYIAIAQFQTKSGSQSDAIAAYETVLALPKLSSGKQIDMYMCLVRIASFYSDSVDRFIQPAHQKAEQGGGADWDRRNRLHIYRALPALLRRDGKEAAGLLRDCLATFNATEFCSYNEFMVYTLLTNVLYLSRLELKKKIIDGPEVITVQAEIPQMMKVVRSLYDCDYQAYLHAMLDLEDVLRQDRFLYPHTAYWMRELHILAYRQYLDSYQSVTLTAMAQAFGVTEDFIDATVSQYICSNRLSAKIDKYEGIIRSSRPDLQNAQYRELIQKGDLLLNRIQKLARVVDF